MFPELHIFWLLIQNWVIFGQNWAQAGYYLLLKKPKPEDIQHKNYVFWHVDSSCLKIPNFKKSQMKSREYEVLYLSSVKISDKCHF